MTTAQIEIPVIAQHVYRMTATKTGNEFALSFWDGTEGADRRTIVKGIRFGKGNNATG